MKKIVMMMVVVGVVVCGVGSSWAGEYVVNEFEVYTGSGDQSYPDISGDVVVWIDAPFISSGGPSGPIHYKDLSTGQDHVIATSQTYSWWGWKPAIDGDTIVWSDTRSGVPDDYAIYSYNVSTQTENIVWADGRQRPGKDLFGDLVVGVEYAGDDDYDIYGYDLSEGTRFPISTDPGYQYFPVTNGDIVVWSDRRDSQDDWDLYAYDLLTQDKFTINTEDYTTEYADISGDIIVWEDTRNRIVNDMNHDIFGFDLSTQTEFAICTNNSRQGSPVIDGDFVVWQDDRNGDFDIFGYDLLTQTEFAIATGLGDQLRPAISGNIVVWESGGDIYGAEIIPEPCTLLLIGFGGLFLRKRKS